MLDYAIYTPISSIMCGIACFERFCRFWLCEPKTCELKKILSLVDQWSWLKSPKLTQHRYTVTNFTIKDEATTSIGREPKSARPATPTGCPWWLPMAAPFLWLLAFFTVVWIPMHFCHEFVHKATFLLFSFGGIPPYFPPLSSSRSF